MVAGWAVVLSALVYLCLLFTVAHWGDRAGQRLMQGPGRATIYALALTRHLDLGSGRTPVGTHRDWTNVVEQQPAPVTRSAAPPEAPAGAKHAPERVGRPRSEVFAFFEDTRSRRAPHARPHLRLPRRGRRSALR